MNMKPKNNRFSIKSAAATLFSLAASVALLGSSAFARDLHYDGNEVDVFVKPGEATQVEFPSHIEGGYKNKISSLALEKKENYLIIFARPEINLDGETIIVHLDDKRTYSLRFLPANEQNPRDGSVKILDNREPEPMDDTGMDESVEPGKKKLAPSDTVAGLMREMIFAAEFGKQGRIAGFRRSNRFSGEKILDDGAVTAQIDEIFMGSDLWGYVVSVENNLNTTQRLNPASFRMDGTRAIVAQRWQLEAQPETAEQKIAGLHRSKLYIVTRAKRR
jgi:hypothetical protein